MQTNVPRRTISPQDCVLVLEDGSVFPAFLAAGPLDVTAEVVFTTSMTGYQEILTDPSFAQQIVVFSYPLIGNYGISDEDNESERIQAAGCCALEFCRTPSLRNGASGALLPFLEAQNIPALEGLDTRALVTHLRDRGVMMGRICAPRGASDAKDALRAGAKYGETDLVLDVARSEASRISDGKAGNVVVVDYGVKRSILQNIAKLGYAVDVVPPTWNSAQILELAPDVVVLSPGPGDPAVLRQETETVRELMQKVPIFGICLGHQLLALAAGGETYKLPFGHRGANHPVQEIDTGKVRITTQNHGYAVREESLRDTGFQVTHRSLHDGTVEGIRHRDLPIYSVQFHPEAHPGPLDTEDLFGAISHLASLAGST